MSTLEKRIASALSDDVTSAELASLVVEVETAITQADAEAETEREKALGVLVSPDAAKARAAAEDAAFTRDRLRNVLPRLQQRHQEVAAQECLARWRGDYDALKVKRDQLAAELREVYRAVVGKLIDLLTRIEACDAEVGRLNGAAPAGVGFRLRGVELEARNLERFTRDEPSISKDLSLPEWNEPAKFAWPPPSPPLSSFIVPPVQAHLGTEWWQGSEKRAAARRLESERVAAYYEDRQRARESTA